MRLSICRFVSIHPKLTMDCVNAIVGRDLTVTKCTDDRVLLSESTPGLQLPARFGSVPGGSASPVRLPTAEGPAKGKSIEAYFQRMRRNYFERMGWFSATGTSLADTLRPLGLEQFIPDQTTGRGGREAPRLFS